TRGGFAFHTTDVCALSDSFFLVTEPQFSSFYQDKNLMQRISAAGVEMNVKATLRGIVVNKATESSGDNIGGKSSTHLLNLENVEGSFRNALVEAFSIRYSDTHPVPLDIQAVEAYKSQRIPYVAFPGSVFSYATLVAFSGLMKTVTVRWPEEVIKRWNALVDLVSNAIKAANEKLVMQIHDEQLLHEDKDKLTKDNELLSTRLRLIEGTVAEKERTYEQFRARQAEVDRRRIWSIAGLIAALFVFATLGVSVYYQAKLQQAVAEEKINALQDELAKLREQAKQQQAVAEEKINALQ